MKKRLVALTLAVVAVLSLLVPAASAASPINLLIDGKKVIPTVDPVVENGTTLVPLRVISETLGADVTWEQSKQQATVKTAAYSVDVTAGSENYTVNGATKTLLLAPKAVNGSTLVPIRAFSEAIGATVNYNPATNTASVDYFTKMSGSLKISGSTTLQPITQAAADKLMSMNSGLSITVSGGGSGTGIKDATAGTVNIGMSSRELTTDEMKSLKVYPVANDGIAIIVNPDNPVKDLTKDQAAKIFLGEIKNWKDVGGNDAPIVVMTRETGSGTRATLEEMILEKKSVVERATPFASSTLIKQAVAKDKNAIGFDSIGFVDSTVKAVSLDGKSATAATVISGSYGMGRQLFCLTNGNASGLSAIFIDYLKTQDCQDNIVVKEGYVKLS